MSEMLTEVAIIGMAGRFPHAANVDEFWRNLSQGVESISFFSDEELLADNVPPALLSNPNYVKSKAVLEGVELFDARFFNINPREAETMDPQQRLFLECVWDAFENAAYDPERFKGRIGVYAGVSMNTYLFNLYSHPGLVESIGDFQTVISNDKDFVATRVSYKLNLRGPSVTVQTACSTSLVAVHLACQSLLNGECDLALAGGSSVRLPQKRGGIYQEGGVKSPDGHCRAFDIKAKGTVSGEGVGVVLLKRLEDALADRDNIHAVIKGSAINNDGALKVGFTAPSVAGQAEVIMDALAMARTEAETISYVEAHGTATTLGDPIEVAALTQAFRATTARTQFCALGSVKTNIGHLDTSAGIAGLIKTVLALKHRQLPPSLHYEEANPEIDFASSPFYVNTKLQEWRSEGARRAGVSSFGIGGTNAHVVLEEAPASSSDSAAKDEPGWQLLVLSAKTETALWQRAGQLSDHLRAHDGELRLADMAHTLQVGRAQFAHRCAVVCRNVEEFAEAVEKGRVLTGVRDDEQRPVVFMFPGQGTQHVDMGHGLYESEKVFRQEVDRCAENLKPHLGFDLREALYPGALVSTEEAATRLRQTAVAQPALFVVEYALAKLLMKWGVNPSAMIGHSIGEYVAACLAGVFSLEDALLLVAARGRLMQQSLAGAMFSVELSEIEAHEWLRKTDKVSVAAVNGPQLCVLSGETEAVESLLQRMAARGIQGQRLHTSHAFHSAMMEPVLGEFARELSRVKFNVPQRPYISNVSGNWIADDEVVQPDYWVRHLRHTVRFADGLGVVMQDPKAVFVEVGPGQSLSTLARRHPSKSPDQQSLTTMRRPAGREADSEMLLRAAAGLWVSGQELKWERMAGAVPRRRVELPTYPFERQRYWVELRVPPNGQHAESEAAPDATSDAVADSVTLYPRPQLKTSYDAPTNEIERTTAAIWQEILGIERVGIHDNFFELGGDSLVVTRLIARLREAFPVELPLESLFEAPTIAELAEVIEVLLIEKIEELPEEEAQRLLSGLFHQQ